MILGSRVGAVPDLGVGLGPRAAVGLSITLKERKKERLGDLSGCLPGFVQ